MTTITTRPMMSLLVATLLVVGCSSGSSDALVVDEPTDVPADYEYLIPQGTAGQIRDGEPIAILPSELDVRVGEVIRIINDDDEGHFVGIFYVGPHETVTQRFSSAGEFIGNCTVHPSAQITLRVHE